MIIVPPISIELKLCHCRDVVARRDCPRIGQYRRGRAPTVKIERRDPRCRYITKPGFPADVLAVRAVRCRSEAAGDGLHPLQEAFAATHSLQCGFAAPHIPITMLAFLAETPEPDEAPVRKALSGDLCRCIGCQHIVDGILLAARQMAMR
jgi:hypothetical protein